MNDRRTLLILSANPKGTNPLCLGEEIREIKEDWAVIAFRWVILSP
jgi:hypothetical protein